MGALDLGTPYQDAVYDSSRVCYFLSLISKVDFRKICACKWLGVRSYGLQFFIYYIMLLILVVCRIIRYKLFDVPGKKALWKHNVYGLTPSIGSAHHLLVLMTIGSLLLRVFFWFIYLINSCRKLTADIC